MQAPEAISCFSSRSPTFSFIFPSTRAHHIPSAIYLVHHLHICISAYLHIRTSYLMPPAPLLPNYYYARPLPFFKAAVLPFNTQGFGAIQRGPLQYFSQGYFRETGADGLYLGPYG
jgi:hypothetical protein